MKTEHNILNQLTPENANPYSTPVGYFEGLSCSILNKINSRQDSYSIPKDYFNNLSSQIIQKIKEDESDISKELKLIAPLLNTIERKNVYNIPSKYFETSKPSIAHKKAKILSVKWVKYVVAASVLGAISIGILINKNVDERALIASYHQAIKTNVEQSLKNMSDAELTKNLDETKIVSDNIADEIAVSPWQNFSDLNEDIQIISDDEMKAYLKENNIEEIESSLSPNS